MEDGFQVRTFDRVSLRSPTHPTAFSDSSQRQIDVTSDRESSRVDGSVSHVWTSKEFAESSQRARRLMRAHVGSLEIIKMSSIATTAGPTTRRPRTRSPRTTSAGGFVFAVLVQCSCSAGALRAQCSCCVLRASRHATQRVELHARRDSPSRHRPLSCTAR